MQGLQKSYNKFNGIYRGLVMNNTDPQFLGRIKIKVFPMFINIEDDHLPGAVPAFSIFSGAGSNFGTFAVPEIGSFVFVFFEGNSVHQPVYFAEAPTAQYGLPDSRTTNYPFRKVTKTKNGIEFYVDDKSKEVKFIHPSGTNITIDGDGNITINGNNNIVVDNNGNIIVNSVGSITLKGSTINLNP